MTVVLLSGGLDSTVLTAQAVAEWERVETVSFNYGQRHRRRELAAARAVAIKLGVGHTVVDLAAAGLAGLWSKSALTDERIPVPEGHYAAESMAVTVVPNRNMIMLAVAGGIAAARGHQWVGGAMHAGDHFIYPDCRPEFLETLSNAMCLGTQGHGDVKIWKPFANWTKAQIVAQGAKLGAPMGLSWSCYQGGKVHCGRCGTCVERAEAFSTAGVEDPTVYADSGYWRAVTS